MGKRKEWPMSVYGGPVMAASGLPFAATHRHHKGGVYQKLFDGYREDNLAPMVVYRDADGTVWIRTREDFEGETEPHSGIARFAKMEPTHVYPDVKDEAGERAMLIEDDLVAYVRDQAKRDHTFAKGIHKEYIAKARELISRIDASPARAEAAESQLRLTGTEEAGEVDRALAEIGNIAFNMKQSPPDWNVEDQFSRIQTIADNARALTRRT